MNEILQNNKRLPTNYECISVSIKKDDQLCNYICKVQRYKNS